jgi:hypothetical protein
VTANFFFRAHEFIVQLFGLLLTIIGGCYLLIHETKSLKTALRNFTRRRKA